LPYPSTTPTQEKSSSSSIEYFKELEEESIRDNFVVIYELLDEVMDFGYPQTTESKILQESVILLVFYHGRDIGAPIHVLITESMQVYHPGVAQT